MAKHRIRKLVAAVATVFAATGTAMAQEAMTGNETIDTAQQLEIQSDGTATVHGVIGTNTGSAVLDVDFYAFDATAGDVVTIMINNGIGGARDVDTVLYLWSPGSPVPLVNDDPETEPFVNPGSTAAQDSRINVTIPATGTYKVAVTGFGMEVQQDGSYAPTPVGQNGDYTLIISGISVAAPTPTPTPDPVPPVGEAPMKIRIDVEPGERNNVVRDKERQITVALLSSDTFNAMDVDPSSLRFGVKGDEASLSKCSPRGHRVDRNRSRDLVCHFKTRYAGFTPGYHEVVLTGKTRAGKAFEGRSNVKYVQRHSSRGQRSGRDD
jgi:hypothetical protein